MMNVQALMLAAMLVASTAGSVDAAMVVERICSELTVMLLIDVLLVPLRVIVLVRGAGRRANSKGVLAPEASIRTA